MTFLEFHFFKVLSKPEPQTIFTEIQELTQSLSSIYSLPSIDPENKSTTEDFAIFPPRPESESPEYDGFRFQRTGPFYKSTRFRETDTDYRNFQAWLTSLPENPY